jgi:hypothetical protein
LIGGIEMNTNLKMILIISLLTIIIVAGCYMYAYKDTLFKNEVTITYYSGCKETFINGKLVTDECTIERRQIEEEKNKTIKPTYNFSFT